jgi:hypothetical protein
VAAIQEVVHARGLEAPALAQRPLLAIQDLAQLPAKRVGGGVEVVALVERPRSIPELLDQLLHAHHPHLHPGQLEAVAAHPLQGLLDAEPLHEQIRHGVEDAARIQGELLLPPVPPAVAMDLHRRV